MPHAAVLLAEHRRLPYGPRSPAAAMKRSPSPRFRTRPASLLTPFCPTRQLLTRPSATPLLVRVWEASVAKTSDKRRLIISVRQATGQLFRPLAGRHDDSPPLRPEIHGIVTEGSPVLHPSAAIPSASAAIPLFNWPLSEESWHAIHGTCGGPCRACIALQSSKHLATAVSRGSRFLREENRMLCNRIDIFR